ncbi:uch1 [Symbiodinium microadriaticum]|nr:uch1 [Symbiodinium microadriaticum]
MALQYFRKAAAVQAQRLAIEKDGQKVSGELVYLKQYVGNACGTIACLHSMANNAEALGLSAESPVGKFLDTIKGKLPVSKALLVEIRMELDHIPSPIPLKTCSSL